MNWFGLIKCVIVIAAVLAAYLVLMNTKFKDKFDEYPFLPLGIILIVLCAAGVVARFIMGV